MWTGIHDPQILYLLLAKTNNVTVQRRSFASILRCHALFLPVVTDIFEDLALSVFRVKFPEVH